MRFYAAAVAQDRDLNTLVRRPSGLFTFTSTVSNYIADNYHTVILINGSRGSYVLVPRHAGLDSFYLQIMISSIPNISSSQLILGTIVCLFNLFSVEQLQKLLGADRLDVPKTTRSKTQAFRRSLRGFLIDS
jgi:hypothetical protein